MDPFDPNRCQASTRTGQCAKQALPGTRYCQQHNGKTYLKAKERDEIKSYQLTRWSQEVDRFQNDPEIKSLRAEIAIARLTLETLLNRCQSVDDLLFAQDKIISMVNQITKTVEKCHTIEEKAGAMLDKNAVVQLAQTIINIIKSHIQDEEILELIVSDIVRATQTAPLNSLNP